MEMTKENEILELARKNKGTITTQIVNENNIPRIYLTKLINNKKLFRVDRGIYSLYNEDVDDYYSMQVKSKKMLTIYS